MTRRAHTLLIVRGCLCAGGTDGSSMPGSMAAGRPRREATFVLAETDQGSLHSSSTAADEPPRRRRHGLKVSLLMVQAHQEASQAAAASPCAHHDCQLETEQA